MEQFTACPQCGQPTPAAHVAAGWAEPPPRRERQSGPLRQLRIARQANEILEKSRERRRRAAEPVLEPERLTPYCSLTARLLYLRVAWGVDIDRAYREMMTAPHREALSLGATSIIMKATSPAGEEQTIKLKAVDGRVVNVVKKEAPAMRLSKEAERSEQQVLSECFREMAEDFWR